MTVLVEYIQIRTRETECKNLEPRISKRLIILPGRNTSGECQLCMMPWGLCRLWRSVPRKTTGGISQISNPILCLCIFHLQNWPRIGRLRSEDNANMHLGKMPHTFLCLLDRISCVLFAIRFYFCNDPQCDLMLARSGVWRPGVQEKNAPSSPQSAKQAASLPYRVPHHLSTSAYLRRLGQSPASWVAVYFIYRLDISITIH